MKFTIHGHGYLGHLETITWEDGKLSSQFATDMAELLSGLKVGPPTQEVDSDYLERALSAYFFLTQRYFENVIEVTGDQVVMAKVPQGAVP